MARSKPSKQLSQAEIQSFLVAAEALHRSISPTVYFATLRPLPGHAYPA
jgi:hypothetical protein